MPVDSASFVFIITLAGVVNGLGIVRWLTGFTDYLRNRSSVRIEMYWVYVLVASFQFFLHILFWWSLWTMRGTATINFLSYVYLLSGPILLYTATSFLMPGGDADELDLKAHYYATRTGYTTILILLWLWAIFSAPLFRGHFAPAMPLFTAFILNAFAMRATANPTVHGIAAVINWILFALLIGLYQLQLGGAGV